MSPRSVLVGALVVIAVVWTNRGMLPTYAQAADQAPSFEVDPAWPKPLPNNWAVGPVSGIATDARDHIWIIQRGEAVKEPGRVPAPPVIEFDPSGAVVQTWGGPGTGYEWPQQVHGITIDAKDRVWISGNGDKDAQILTFTRTGKFLLQIGHSGKNGGSNDTMNLGRATQMRVDPRRNEVFVSDGEMNQNHRVIVFDSENGAYKRHWGAYGAKPDDAVAAARPEPAGPPPRQFGNAVHCVRLDRDDLVYVCDRSNSRFQLFRKDGSFQKEIFIAKDSGGGAVADLDFSPDQKFIYVADGGNQKVWILLRDQLKVIGSFGGKGSEPGHFATTLHDMTVDSEGNIYTGEAATAGRVQKFALKQRQRP
jgi:hypothetical protein